MHHYVSVPLFADQKSRQPSCTNDRHGHSDLDCGLCTAGKTSWTCHLRVKWPGIPPTVRTRPISTGRGRRWCSGCLLLHVLSLGCPRQESASERFGILYLPSGALLQRCPDDGLFLNPG